MNKRQINKAIGIAERLADLYEQSNDLYFREHPELEKGIWSTVDLSQERADLESEIKITVCEFASLVDKYEAYKQNIV